MKVLKNVSLKLHTTMRLGGTAEYVVEVKKEADLTEAEAWAEARELPVIVIGSGSNIIWRDEGFKGLLIINKIKGLKKVGEDAQSATYQIGAGEKWDTVVANLVSMGLSGVESLSLIPGTAGAAPVQNIGAYGQEIAQTLVELRAYDRMQKAFVTLTRDQCAYGYRTSRFKTVDKDRFMISSITLKLSKTFAQEPKYADLTAYFEAHGTTEFTPEIIRKAVIAVRTKKLPDPSKTANCGSYFGNPVVTKAEFTKLVKKYPAIKKPLKGWSQAAYWETKDGNVKVGAGWLIEAAGFTSYKDPATGMSLWPTQHLVFVNDKAQKTDDLLRFEQKITDKVMTMFGIELQREPELLP